MTGYGAKKHIKIILNIFLIILVTRPRFDIIPISSFSVFVILYSGRVTSNAEIYVII